ALPISYGPTCAGRGGAPPTLIPLGHGANDEEGHPVTSGAPPRRLRSGSCGQATVASIVTGMLPRVAFEYGQTLCAASISWSAVAWSTPASSACSAALRPYVPPSSAWIPTSATTAESVKVIFCAAATPLSALWKQDAQPAAKSCSGLVPPPGPPMAVGMARVRSRTPSSVAAWPPARPSPVE